VRLRAFVVAFVAKVFDTAVPVDMVVAALFFVTMPGDTLFLLLM
jgi:hypothetical protein